MPRCRPSLFEKAGIEIQSQTYPNERLIACRNRHLANQTQQKREALLRATETELDKIVVATRRSQKRLEGEAEIGLRVGKVLNRSSRFDRSLIKKKHEYGLMCLFVFWPIMSSGT